MDTRPNEEMFFTLFLIGEKLSNHWNADCTNSIMSKMPDSIPIKDYLTIRKKNHRGSLTHKKKLNAEIKYKIPRLIKNNNRHLASIRKFSVLSVWFMVFHPVSQKSIHLNVNYTYDKEGILKDDVNDNLSIGLWGAEFHTFRPMCVVNFPGIPSIAMSQEIL